MFRLYCDLCNTEITPADRRSFPMVKLTIEEMKYLGESKDSREFLADEECVDHKAYLCSGCASRLRQFMNLDISTGYTFKGE